jgi:hypothetical protein
LEEDERDKGVEGVSSSEPENDPPNCNNSSVAMRISEGPMAAAVEPAKTTRMLLG